MLANLQGVSGIPELFATLYTDEELWVIIERLDHDLESLRGSLSTRELAILAGKVFDALRSLHASEVVHCDVKPQNFMVKFTDSIGTMHEFPDLDKEDEYSVYMIDFGLSQRISNISEPGKGSPRYKSINIMKGGQQSYADDAVSAVYSLVYLAQPKSVPLPWSGLEVPEGVSQNEIILQKKEATTVEELCRDVPPPFRRRFADLLVYFQSLEHATPPDYDLARDMLEGKKFHMVHKEIK